MNDWLRVTQGDAPLLVSLPHTGTHIPDEFAPHFVSTWLALKDTDWHIDNLYDFADDLGATIVRTAISRSVIDVNRDPSGRSLYPGQATTGLCPQTTFDGEPLYKDKIPGADDIARHKAYFDPYHAALEREIARLRKTYRAIVLYDCHSIRSIIPRLFEGTLPHFNIGTDDGKSCAPKLTMRIEKICAATPYQSITNGRFKGGYITRHYGKPAQGVHGVQMELAYRTYLQEPLGAVDESNWPASYDEKFAAPARAILKDILQNCLAFAKEAA